MRYRSLFVFTLSLLAAVPASAQSPGPATPSEASRPTQAPSEAMRLARSAAKSVESALDRTVASLDALLRQGAPRAGLKLQVFRAGAPLDVRPTSGRGALGIDRATLGVLRRNGSVIHYYPTPAPHFLVAVETRAPRSHGLGVEVTIRDLVAALDTVPLPSSAQLEVLARDGRALAHPERPLAPEELAIAATMAGHGAHEARLERSVLGYAPIGTTGVGILVRSALSAPAAPRSTASLAATPSTPVPTLAPTLAPAPTPSARPAEAPAHAPSLAAWGLPVGFGALGLAVLLLVIGWLRRRWHAQLSAAEPVARAAAPSDEAARQAAAVASVLPTLRESLGTASRSLDRAYVSTSGQAPSSEAMGLAQDLTEQASGLVDRLRQSEAPAGEQPFQELSHHLTQLALDLALSAAKPDPEGVLRVVARLRELAGTVGSREGGVSSGPSITYVLELATSLQARCERLESELSSSGADSKLMSQLQMARDALERANVQVNLLSDRVRALERSLPLPENPA